METKTGQLYCVKCKRPGGFMGQSCIYWNNLCDECYFKENRKEKLWLDTLCEAVRANKEDRPKKKFRG